MGKYKLCRILYASFIVGAAVGYGFVAITDHKIIQ
jgi:hypothetical protein